MCPCPSPIKKQSLLPLPLDLDWPRGLFSWIECSQNDAVQLLNLGLKSFAFLFLLFRILAPRSCPGKEARAGHVGKVTWRAKDRVSLHTILAQAAYWIFRPSLHLTTTTWETDDTGSRKKQKQKHPNSTWTLAKPVVIVLNTKFWYRHQPKT